MSYKKEDAAKIMGERLMIIRNRFGMKQSELAEKLELSRGYISNLESGKKLISTDILIRVAELFNTELSFFYPIKKDLSIPPKTASQKEPTTEDKVNFLQDDLHQLKTDMNEIKSLMIKFLSKE